MNRFFATITALVFIFPALPAQHQLVKLWETDTVLKVPESVLYDKKANLLYVSNIEGQPWEKDGKGSIGKIGTDGKIIEAEWVTGLHAPKGMGMHQNNLYVADMDRVVVIDINTGIIVNTIEVKEAQTLNDISVDKSGVVYVSDSRGKKIFRIENDMPALWIDSLKGPNGVLVMGKDVYVLDQGAMYKIDKNKKMTKVTEGMEGGTDGIENVEGNDFIVSTWGGVIYYVKEDGKMETLLDTREQKINAADIGYDAKNRIVYVPTFWKNSVAAYQLK